MNLRHAAALALVGWYLITPPSQFEPPRLSNGTFDRSAPFSRWLPNGVPNLNAPFKYWRNDGSYDSAKECNSAIESNIQELQQAVDKLRSRHLSEQQQSAEDDKDDQFFKLPTGWSHGTRHYGLTAAMSAQCIASDDPRLAK